MFKFKECRERANLTQKEAAFALDVSIQSISNWENEVRRPSLEQLIKIAELYKVTTDELLGRVPMEIKVIKENAPPPSEDEYEIVIEPDEPVPSADDLERRITEIFQRELQKKGL